MIYFIIYLTIAFLLTLIEGLGRSGILKRLGVFIRTSKHANKVIFTIGDTLYGIGISVVASVLYAYFVDATFTLLAGLLGGGLILVGFYIRTFARAKK